MKYLFTILATTMLIVSGCSNDESMKDLIDENEQLKQVNEKLLVEKEMLESDQTIEVSSELSQENDKLNDEIRILQSENEVQKETIIRYQNAFELLNTDALSIFSLERVKKGSQIAGLKVSDIKKETANDSTSYFVKFTGEFAVKGTIFHDVIGGSQYTFVVNENLERIPHTIEQFERGSVYFEITNEEEFYKLLSDKLEKIPENGELIIEAVFKNYSYSYVPETDFPSFAEFVRLVAEE